MFFVNQNRDFFTPQDEFIFQKSLIYLTQQCTLRLPASILLCIWLFILSWLHTTVHFFIYSVHQSILYSIQQYSIHPLSIHPSNSSVPVYLCLPFYVTFFWAGQTHNSPNFLFLCFTVHCLKAANQQNINSDPDLKYMEYAWYPV